MKVKAVNTAQKISQSLRNIKIKWIDYIIIGKLLFERWGGTSDFSIYKV